MKHDGVTQTRAPLHTRQTSSVWGWPQHEECYCFNSRNFYSSPSDREKMRPTLSLHPYINQIWSHSQKANLLSRDFQNTECYRTHFKLTSSASYNPWEGSILTRDRTRKGPKGEPRPQLATGHYSCSITNKITQQNYLDLYWDHDCLTVLLSMLLSI